VFTIVTLHGRQNASFLEKQGKFGKKQILEKSKFWKKAKLGKNQSLEKEQFGGDMLVLAS
jgi:hypothetical protein